MRADVDILVVGGGVIGTAIAYGLARRGQRVVLFDEGDTAHRAAVGNFGLIWVQGKGFGSKAYIEWTRRSAELWPQFDAELRERTGVDIAYQHSGGIHVCVTDEELQARRDKLAAVAETSQGRFTYEMLDHARAAQLLPGLGGTVAGGSYCTADGRVNPLRLLRALQAGFQSHGGQCVRGEPVADINLRDGGFIIAAEKGHFAAGKVVVAAGLGNAALGPQVGINVLVRPQRGQILVTERVAPFLNLPTTTVNQTEIGTVLLGVSHEAVGLDNGVAPQVMQAIARRAATIFPRLKRARVVRAWGALRPLMPDDLPLYEFSQHYPGACLACSHSGVTLAAVHATDLAGHIIDGALPSYLSGFNGERFNAHNN